MEHPRTRPRAGRRAALATAAYLLLFAGQSLGWPRPQVKRYAAPLLDERVGYGVAEGRDFLVALGTAGRRLFLVAQLVDLAIAGIGVLAAWWLAGWLLQRAGVAGGVARRLRIAVPATLALAELADNGFLIAVTLAGARAPDWLLRASMVATAAKYPLFALVLLSFATLAVLALARRRRWFSRRRRPGRAAA